MREIQKTKVPQSGVVDPTAKPPLADLEDNTAPSQSTHRTSKVGTILPKKKQVIFMPGDTRKSSANTEKAINFALYNRLNKLTHNGDQEWEKEPWAEEAWVWYNTFQDAPEVANSLFGKLAATTLDASGKNSNRRAEEIAIDAKLMDETISELIRMKVQCAKEAAEMVKSA